MQQPTTETARCALPPPTYTTNRHLSHPEHTHAHLGTHSCRRPPACARARPTVSVCAGGFLGTHGAMTPVPAPPLPPSTSTASAMWRSCLVWLFGLVTAAHAAAAGGTSTRRNEGHSATGQQSWRLGGVGRHLNDKHMQRGAVVGAQSRRTATRVTSPFSGLRDLGSH